MNRIKSAHKHAYRKSSGVHKDEGRLKRRMATEGVPRHAVTISITADGGSSVSVPVLTDNDINGGVSRTTTGPACPSSREALKETDPIAVASSEKTSRREVRGQIVSAKVSLERVCINCRSPLYHCNTSQLSALPKCRKCGHAVVYREMPQTVTADITLKTTTASEPVLPLSLSHSLMQRLVPLDHTGCLQKELVEQQLLEMNVSLLVEDQEVIDICGRT
ncbi:uncharacterized protein LOC134464718 [Engraulis encrasicolus]|uniref:uncharacterized protein LOC134464718 n=1 Tax=Engraulis encrasicolus TaxID=184585 RepID=UPI002FD19680